MSPSDREVVFRPRALGPWRMRTTVTRDLYFVREDVEGVSVATVSAQGPGLWVWELRGGMSGEGGDAAGAKAGADQVLREMGYTLG